MAQYIDETILGEHMGSDVVTQIIAYDVDLDEKIETGTDLIRAYLRNSGYEAPDTDTPADITDATVRLAVVCVVWELLAATPSASLPLPAGWSTSPFALARDGILSGSATLNLTRSTAASVGGFLAPNSDGTLTAAQGGRPPRASRDELSGF